MASREQEPREDFRGLLLRLRGRTGQTQLQLAQRAGVHVRSVQAWEAGLNIPKAEPLQALIGALLSAGGFARDREAAEAEALWCAADRQSSRQHPPFDAQWFATLLSQSLPKATPQVVACSPTEREVEWGDAPDSVGLVGRQAELETLQQWLTCEQVRLVLIRGIGGVGKSRLAARVCGDVAHDFDRVHWRSLHGTPSFGDWSAQLIRFLSGAQADVPATGAGRIEMLLRLMRSSRCLLILDRLEVLLQPGQCDGSFRSECATYADFLVAAGERKHRSCVLLTSREVPSQLPLIGEHVLELAGFSTADAQVALSGKGLVGTASEWAELVTRYSGNAHTLKVVANTICEVFGGDIRQFLAELPEGTMLDSVHRVVEGQCQRLSPVERQVVTVLAAARRPISFVGISSELAPRANRTAVMEAIEGLRHRSLVERNRAGGEFVLQSVVSAYVTDRGLALAG